MNDTTSPSGIMQPKKELTALRQQIRNALGPTKALTLDEKLAQLSEVELKNLLQTARFVQFGMSLPNNHSKSYADIALAMYPKMQVSRRDLIAEMLQDAEPVQAVGLTPKNEPDYTTDVYAEWESLQPTEDDRVAAALQSAIADTFSAEAEKQTDTPPATNTRSLVQRPSSTFEGKNDFLARMTPVAKEVAGDLGISHKIVLAQAALESGWGKSLRSNNLMGIKSHGKAGGADVVTHEVIDGKRVKITDSFRQYDTPEDSIRGYGQFLKDNKRYKHFLKAGASGNETTQLSALQSSGYATDPDYAQKLAAIIKGIPDDEDDG